MTNIQIFHEGAERTMKQVMYTLGWDEMEYAEYRFLNGIAYLQWYEPVNENMRAKLRLSATYWGWFKKLCTENDESFLEWAQQHPKTTSFELHSIYASFHCPRILARECRPDAVVLHDLKKQTV